MILIIDSDEVFAECVLGALKKNGYTGQVFKDAIEAIREIEEDGAPEMVFLDPMLTGPDGFTFLNEMASYADTMKTPIVIVSERDFSEYNLSDYGVVGYLDKNTMTPEKVVEYARKYA